MYPYSIDLGNPPFFYGFVALPIVLIVVSHQVPVYESYSIDLGNSPGTERGRRISEFFYGFVALPVVHAPSLVIPVPPSTAGNTRLSTEMRRVIIVSHQVPKVT